MSALQEMDSHGRFIADIWKRFVVDEEIDCRVNYGFTSKRKFGDSMKIQELNYENVPVIEEVRDRPQGLRASQATCGLLADVKLNL